MPKYHIGSDSKAHVDNIEDVDALKYKLQLANIQLESLQKHWEEDNADAQEIQSRLRGEIEVAKREMMQAQAKAESNDVGKNLNKSKKLIEELESQLCTERSRIRTLTIKQADIAKQKDDIIQQMRRTEEVCRLIISPKS